MAKADEIEQGGNTEKKDSDNAFLKENLLEKDKEDALLGSTEENEESNVVSRREKVLRSMALYIVFFAGTGLPLFGVGPCLLDLQILTASTTQQISYVFTARSIGALIGGCFEGFFIDRKNPWLTMAVTTATGNLMFLIAPQFGDLWSLVGIMSLHGLFYGVYSTCVNITLTRIWGKDQGPWMQGLHMVGTMGGVVAPLLAKPFLSDSVPHVESIDHEGKGMEHNHTHVNVTQVGADVADVSNVKNYFVMVGALGIVSSLGMWFFFCTGDRKLLLERKRKKVVEAEDENVARGRILRVVILSMMFVFYTVLSVYGRGYPNYTMAFTVEYLGWSKLHGALLTSLYLGVYVLGRIAGIFIISYVTPQTVIVSDLVLSISATIPVILFVQKHVSVYWICTLLYGLGNATIFASGFPWLAQYFKMSGNVGSVPQIGGFVGDILGPPLVGYLFEYVTPMGFIYVSTGGGILCLILIILMQMLGKRYVKVNAEKSTLELKVPAQLSTDNGEP